jgi:hypothetical protein
MPKVFEFVYFFRHCCEFSEGISGTDGEHTHSVARQQFRSIADIKKPPHYVAAFFAQRAATFSLALHAG